MSFDALIFKAVNGLAHKFFLLDWLGIFFADYSAYLLVLYFIFILFKLKDRKERIYLFSLSAISVILSRGIVTEIIRYFWHRPRPFAVLGLNPLILPDMTYSFPSGHAATYFALAGVAILFSLDFKKENNRTWAWIFGAGAVFMGLGRVFAGVHWPSDIFGGAILGLSLAYFCRRILLPYFLFS